MDEWDRGDDVRGERWERGEKTRNGNEIDGIRRSIAEERRERLWMPDGESCLPVGEVRDARPDLLRGSPEDAEDAIELVDLRVAGEHGGLCEHLAEDDPDGPDVDWRRILLLAQQHLRGAVPQRHHLVRVSAQRDPERPCKPKVRKLQRPESVDQQVLWLHVPVEDPVRVAVLHPAKHLEHVTLHQKSVHRRSPQVVHVPLQVLIHELEHQVKFASDAHDIQKACVCVFGVVVEKKRERLEKV